MAIATDIQPVGDRLLLRALKDERKIGLIHIPQNASNKLDVVVSQVVARGTEVKSKPWELAVGDYVLHVRVAGVKYDGTLGRIGNKDADFIFIREKEVMAVVSPESVGQVVGQASLDGGKTGSRALGDL